MSQFTGAIAGPMLRAWQADPFNRNAQYFQGFDAPVCMGALTAAIGAPWVSKSGKTCLTAHIITNPSDTVCPVHCFCCVLAIVEGGYRC